MSEAKENPWDSFFDDEIRENCDSCDGILTVTCNEYGEPQCQECGAYL